MIILLRLILAHLIGDFLLQPRSWIQEKERKKIKSPKLYLHVLIHGGLVLLLLWNLADWGLALIIMGCHYAIDLLKLYQQKGSNKTSWFWADQVLHIISIVVFYWIWFRPQWQTNFGIHPDFWIFATALVFITAVSGIIIQMLMQQWAKEINERGDLSLKNAGKYIGILERLFVFVFVISGHWAPLGFLLGAKSIFRFGDLREAKDRKLTEYILIGTLLSIGIAIATAMITKYIVFGL
jgi:hypothetical protein